MDSSKYIRSSKGGASVSSGNATVELPNSCTAGWAQASRIAGIVFAPRRRSSRNPSSGTAATSSTVVNGDFSNAVIVASGRSGKSANTGKGQHGAVYSRLLTKVRQSVLVIGWETPLQARPTSVSGSTSHCFAR